MANRTRAWTRSWMLGLGLGLGLLVGCKGGGGVTPPALPPLPMVPLSMGTINGQSEVKAGRTLNFTVQVYGGASHEVEWTADAGTIQASSTQQEPAEAIFTAPSNAGLVTITARAKEAPRPAATLTVTVLPSGIPVTIDPIQSPTLTVQKGTSITVSTTARGGQTNTVAWSSSRGSIEPLGTGTTPSQATFTAPATAGVVVISAASRDFSGASTSLSLQVVDTAPPITISTIQAGATSLQAGQTMDVSATVTGGTTRKVQWSVKDNVGTLVPKGTGTTPSVATYTAPEVPGGLAFITVTLQAAAEEDPSVLSTLDLKVVPPPPVIRISPILPADPVTVPGGSITLHATVTGGTTNLIEWSALSGTFSGKTLTSAVFKAPDTLGRVVVTATAAEDSTQMAQVTVTVKSEIQPTVITGQPQGTTVVEGTPATLSVTATGDSLVYQWLKNGNPYVGPGSTTAALSWDKVTPMDAGTYQVKVTGADGVTLTSREAVLTVVALPVIQGFSASPATVGTGGSSTLSYSYFGGNGVIDQGIGPIGSIGAGGDGFGNGTVTVTPPATTTYTLTVSKTLNGVTAQVSKSATVTVDPTLPVLTGFLPAAAAAGETVTLSGHGFTGATRVFLGANLDVSTFTVVSDSETTFTVPDAATTSLIHVVTPKGQADAIVPLQVKPGIRSLTPSRGTASVSQVQIGGTAFGGATAVSFNGTPSAFTVDPGGTLITTFVPTGATTGLVTVTTPAGTATSASPFTVVPMPTVTAFTASAASFPFHAGTTLSVAFTGGTGTLLPQNQPVASGDTVTLTRYGGSVVWLQVDNGAGGVATQALALNPTAPLAAWNHSLVATQDQAGTVFGFGEAAIGQLGLAFSGDARTPLSLSLAGRTGVACGNRFSLVLTAGGGLLSTGDNAQGQLGNGTTTDQAFFAPVLGSDGATPVSGLVAAAAGDSHAVALDSAGRVWSWGNGANGQLGRPGGANTLPGRVLDARDAPLAGFQSLAAGLQHTLAVASDGTVWGWGFNSSDCITPVLPSGQVPRAVPIGGLTSVVAVAGGFNHSLALDSQGRVWSWGNNARGQLGRPGGSAAPSLVPGLPPGRAIIAIAARGDNSLALDSSGQAWAWGANDLGQCGDGALEPADQPAPVAVQQAGAVVFLAAGLGHTLLLGQDGSAWAVGSDLRGQRGMGRAAVQSLPRPSVQGLAAIASEAQAAFVVARTPAGEVQAWGSNDYKQLGSGVIRPWSAPRKIKGLPSTGLTGLAVGSMFALGQDATGGGWGWGSNQTGALGNANLATLATPVPVLTGAGSPMTNLARLSAGYSHTLILDQGGQLWAAGANGVGQLGDGSTDMRSAPVAVAGLPQATVRPFAGNTFSFAALSDGSLWAWGSNNLNLLGSSGPSSAVPLRVSQAPSTATNHVVDMGLGAYHALALTSTGEVWGWGSGEVGQLGLGFQGGAPLPPTRIPLPAQVVGVAAGYQHSLALDASGTVWSWGSNKYGQIGNGRSGTGADAGSPVSIPLPLPQGGRVVAIAAAMFSSFALDDAGTLYAWGDDSQGQLGLGTLLWSATALRVPGVAAW